MPWAPPQNAPGYTRSRPSRSSLMERSHAWAGHVEMAGVAGRHRPKPGDTLSVSWEIAPPPQALDRDLKLRRRDAPTVEASIRFVRSLWSSISHASNRYALICGRVLGAEARALNATSQADLQVT